MCMVCTNAKDMGENVGLFCCLSYFCFPCGVYLLRKKARELYGIEVRMAKGIKVPIIISEYSTQSLITTMENLVPGDEQQYRPHQ